MINRLPEDLLERLSDLLRESSCSLPKDVIGALRNAAASEKASGHAASILETCLRNAETARKNKSPVCQDTGQINFLVSGPADSDRIAFRQTARKAVARCTGEAVLRKNAVCPVTGVNSGNNLGPGSPAIYWEDKPSRDLNIRLMLKGGGCENCARQYSLPDSKLKADRSLDGAAKCVLDAVLLAQGKACPPCGISVCLGGDRASSALEAKKLFFRKIGSRNKNPELAEFEDSLLSQINSLGIGPMGLGGKTTALSVFANALHRVPASYFVTVNFMCWAWRRRKATIAAS